MVSPWAWGRDRALRVLVRCAVCGAVGVPLPVGGWAGGRGREGGREEGVRVGGEGQMVWLVWGEVARRGVGVAVSLAVAGGLSPVARVGWGGGSRSEAPCA